MTPPHELEAIVSRFGLAASQLAKITTGLINETFLVHAADGSRWILQSVNPIFKPEVHEDIEAVTAHLAAKGLLTPRLRRTTDQKLHADVAGKIWRMMSFVEGATKNRLHAPGEAREAGRMLGRFQRAVSDLQHTFEARRLGVHDTPKHLATLERALDEHTGHRLHADVAPMGREILSRARDLPKLPETPERVVHGDPKANNILFDPETGRARCMVDLDTVGPMALPLELGDAFRSWCNPSGEDATVVHFDTALFRGAVEGYAEEAAAFISPDERGAIVLATETIILELSSRFAADALNERYFGWDATRHATRGDHNLLRARAQLALARDIATRRAEAGSIAAAAFGA